jgi:hypothetical protein
MTLPLQVTPVAVRQFFDPTGAPALDYTLSFFEAGTTTPLEVFADADGNVSLGTSVSIGDLGYPITSGNAITSIYPPLGGYKEVLTDADGQTVYTADHLENVAETFLGTEAVAATVGSKDVTGVYQMVSTDRWITADSATVNLLTAAEIGLPVVVQSVGSGTVAVTPNGADTINGVSGAYTLAAASSPSFPAISLYSDGISNWYATVTS